MAINNDKEKIKRAFIRRGVDAGLKHIATVDDRYYMYMTFEETEEIRAAMRHLKNLQKRMEGGENDEITS